MIGWPNNGRTMINTNGMMKNVSFFHVKIVSIFSFRSFYLNSNKKKTKICLGKLVLGKFTWHPLVRMLAILTNVRSLNSNSGGISFECWQHMQIMTNH